MVAFANATAIGESHSVVLVGGWGGETPEELMTKTCTFSGYPPGDAFCRFLMPNSSWEMGIYNAKRAFACLDPKVEKDALRHLAQYEATVEVDSQHLNWLDPGVSVKVQFGPGPNPEHTSLTITARREMPN